MPEDFVSFLRQRDYKLVRFLKQGATGRTALLADEDLGMEFVCKRYTPYSEDEREELYERFVQEARILYSVLHRNVVRVFNAYLFPDTHTGYLLMEFVDGNEILPAIRDNPASLDDVFLQTVDAFVYLEELGVLHRDIRPANLMVTSDGVAKVIDFGFGKVVEGTVASYGKSISLNWWCDLPLDFEQSIYDHRTEVYFVGKLFEHVLRDSGVGEFQFRKVVREMAVVDPTERITSFRDVRAACAGKHQHLPKFDDDEVLSFQDFIGEVVSSIGNLYEDAKFKTDVDAIIAQLTDIHALCMLQEYVPDSRAVLRSFIAGGFTFLSGRMTVEVLRDFLEHWRGMSTSKRRIVLNNVHSALNGIKRNTPKLSDDDDLPF